jgi:succinate dehydrogenase / fumarate reductase cytochrome b subunit
VSKTVSKTESGRQGFLDRHYFILRRLHSLTGIVPIGIFLIAHLVTNSSLAWGKFGLRADGQGVPLLEGGVIYFNKEVTWINTQVPHLLLIEVSLWVAIGFHSILGLYYARTGRSNTTRYAYQDNWRYTLQRWSGYIGILFIFYHVATLRWGWTFLVPGGTKWSHEYSVSTLVAAVQGSTEGWTAMGLVVSVFYFLGISLLVFHFANGLWTAAITWGLTVSQQAQRRWGVVCAGLGVMLMAAAWSALGAVFITNHDDAYEVERAMLLEKYGNEAPEEIFIVPIEIQTNAATEPGFTLPNPN